MPLLEFCEIEKSFFGVPVLKGITFGVGAGRVVGLVGENGAGKSTLMNILGGVVPRDAGTLRLDGEEYDPGGPGDATARGIAFIHQELNLFPNLSVEENLFLSQLPCRSIAGIRMIDRRTLRDRARALLEAVDLAVDPRVPVERLSQGERQLVEIARALGVEARVIILDEPTTSLTAREAERLFGIIQRLRSRGISMIYISHVLGDVLRICDDVVVLRDGRLVGAGPRESFQLDTLISLMVGRTIDQLYPPRSAVPSSETVLSVRGLSHPGIVEGIELDLRRGEILGLAGIMGSGRTEVARMLFGLDPHERGEVLLGGAPIHGLAPRRRAELGMAFLTENRRDDGLLLDASIADNLALVWLRRFAGPLMRGIRGEALSSRVEDVARRVRLDPDGIDRRLAKALSGGNQQKVVLGKWLLETPSVFILDEPTRGIDVGARYEVYRILDEVAGRGAGLLVISSEMEELMGICDRIIVLRRGEIGGAFARPEFSKERILRAALSS